MPNYITNRLIIKSQDKETVAKVLDYVKGENLAIDFNKIVPMPKDLDIESGSLGEMGRDYIMSLYGHTKAPFMFYKLTKERREKCIELGLKYIQNKARYGHETWYEWCCANWGTKWNAAETYIKNNNEIWFVTAWDGVVKLMETLSAKFPGIEFLYSFADEDIGYNTGHGIIKDGIADMNYPEGGSKEGYEIVFELGLASRDDYELVDDKYVYKEEE